MTSQAGVLSATKAVRPHGVAIRVLPTLVQRLVRPLLKFICLIFLRWEVRGQKNLALVGNMIFASNHVHELDSFIVGAALPWFSRHVPLYYVTKPRSAHQGSKSKVFTFLYGRWFFPFLGALAADVGYHDYERTLSKHIRLLREGKNVCIFPEGVIIREDRVTNVRGGVAYMAEATNLPIIPVRIEGIDRMTMSDFFMRKRKMKITFGKPFYLRDLNLGGIKKDGTKYKEISSRIVDEIYRL